MWGDIFSAISEALTGAAKLQLSEAAANRQRAIQEGVRAKQDARGLLTELYKQRATPGIDNETAARIDAQIARLSPLLSMSDEDAGKAMAEIRKPTLRPQQPVANPEGGEPSVPFIFDAARPLQQTVNASPKLWAQSQAPESAVASTGQAAAGAAAITPNLLLSLLANEATRPGGEMLAAAGWDEEGNPRTPWAQSIELLFGKTFIPAARAGHARLKKTTAEADTAQTLSERAAFDLDVAKQQAPLVLKGLELDNLLKQENIALTQNQRQFLEQTLASRVQAIIDEGRLKGLQADKAQALLQAEIERYLEENDLFKAEAADKKKLLAQTFASRVIQAEAAARQASATATQAELTVDQLKAMQPLQRADAVTAYAERVDPDYWDTPQGRQMAEMAGTPISTLKRISKLAMDTREANARTAQAQARDLERRVRIGEALEAKEVESLSKDLEANIKAKDDFLKNFEMDASTRRMTEIGNLAKSGLFRGETIKQWLSKFGVYDDKELADFAQTADFAYWLSREPRRKEKWAIIETIIKSPPADPTRKLTINGREMTQQDAQLQRLVSNLIEAGLSQAEADAIKVATRNTWETYYRTRSQEDLERGTRMALNNAQINFYNAQSVFQFANAQYLKDKIAVERAQLGLEGRRLDIADKQATAQLISALAQSKDADKRDAASQISLLSTIGSNLRAENQMLSSQVQTVKAKAQNAGCLNDMGSIINDAKCQEFAKEFSALQQQQAELAQRNRAFNTTLQRFAQMTGIDFTFDPSINPNVNPQTGQPDYRLYRTPQMERLTTSQIITEMGNMITRSGGNLTPEQRNTLGAYESILNERGYSRENINRLLNSPAAQGATATYTPYVERMSVQLDQVLKSSGTVKVSSPELWRALAAIESSGGVNAQSGKLAGGPLQIIPTYIPGASYTQQQLNNMSPDDYAKVVNQYIKGNPIVQTALSSPDTPLWKVYVAWHHPTAFHLGPSGVVYRKGTSAYAANASLDRGNKGYVSIQDLIDFVERQVSPFGLSANMRIGELK